MQKESAPVESTVVDEGDIWSIDTISSELQRRLVTMNGVTIGQKVMTYEGFGSFHSENVEDLVAMDDSTYCAPSIPPFARRILGLSELQKVEAAEEEEEKLNIWGQLTQLCEFGSLFRQEHFSMTPDFVFINHGAFGGSLRGALAIKRGYEDLMERQVVEFMDRILLPHIVYSVRYLSKFINADPKQVVLIQNATYALNCAIRLIEKEDIVAFFDTEYLSVYKMMYLRCNDVGAELHEIPLLKYLHNETIMGNDEAITREICHNLPNGCTTVVLDYITSTSALCFPIFTHIIPALRSYGVKKIIVDGAHSSLQVDLNFNNLSKEAQPSVFVGNLHKWFSNPKSAGFMWVHKSLLDSIRSVVFSHGANDGFLSEFIWDGTRDYGAYLSIPAVIDFWRLQDIHRVQHYCSALLQGAMHMLTFHFGTRLVARHAPFMSLVELPEAIQIPCITARHIQDILHDMYKIEVPVKRVEGRFYVRISVFVYNTSSDYVYLREAILGISRMCFFSQLRQQYLLRVGNTSVDTLKSSYDSRVLEEGGCGVLGLDVIPKKKKTTRFS